jgi:hypothetical protein
VADDGTPIKPGTSFGGGTKEVWALFDYQNMAPDTPWRREWTLDGKVVAEVDETWIENEAGWIAYPMMEAIGLTGGTYVFSLYIQDQLVQQGSFTVDPMPGAILEILNKASFGSIVFCEDVTDDGTPVNPSTEFPGDTTRLYAYFTYKNMVRGQPWGRLWELDGEEYINATDDEWERDAEGWRAYSIGDEDGLEEGRYTLTLYIGEKVVQEASFDVAPPARPRPTNPPSFGPISFATRMTEDRQPIGAATRFEVGVTQVYAIFPYFNMASDQSWDREWLQDGEVIAERGDYAWDGDEEDVTYLSLSGPDGKPMAAARYTLNLYLDGELARTASFEVVAVSPTAVPPARPEDIIHPKLLPAWYKLANMHDPNIDAIINVALKYHIPIKFGDVGKANAAYLFGSKTCNTKPGEIWVSPTHWSQNSWEMVASTMAHELTHAYRVLGTDKPCYCTIEDEYYAFMVKLYVLWKLNRMDLVDAYFRDCFDASGRFNAGLLWRKVRSMPAYKECPDR